MAMRSCASATHSAGWASMHLLCFGEAQHRVGLHFIRALCFSEAQCVVGLLAAAHALCFDDSAAEMASQRPCASCQSLVHSAGEALYCPYSGC